MPETTTTHISGVRTIAVPVLDQETALTFYVEKLGFEKRFDTGFRDRERWIEVAPPGAETTIALVRPSEGQAAGIDTGVRLETDDADTDHADLRARGVGVDPEILRWPGVPAMFSLRDPDGNRLVVIGRGG